MPRFHPRGARIQRQDSSLSKGSWVNVISLIPGGIMGYLRNRGGSNSLWGGHEVVPEEKVFALDLEGGAGSLQGEEVETCSRQRELMQTGTKSSRGLRSCGCSGGHGGRSGTPVAEVEGAAYAEVAAHPRVLLCLSELFRPPWPLTWKSLEIRPPPAAPFSA